MAVYISSAEELDWFANTIETGHDYEGEYVSLICNLDLSEYAEGEGWKPIGSEAVPFAGIFDGCGYTITGLTVNRPKEDYQGLFGSVSGIVKNIRLRNCRIVGKDFTGSIAGFVNSGIIHNISTIGEIHGGNIVGGIVGSSSNSTLKENRFQGYISGGNNIGGISGMVWQSKIINNLNMSGKIKGRGRVGGVTGSLFQSELERCRCTGHINGRNSVGGIVGRIEDGNVVSCTAACSVNGSTTVGAVGGYACGKNVIDSCVLVCSVFDGTKNSVNIAEQIFTYDSES